MPSRAHRGVGSPDLFLPSSMTQVKRLPTPLSLPPAPPSRGKRKLCSPAAAAPSVQSRRQVLLWEGGWQRAGRSQAEAMARILQGRADMWPRDCSKRKQRLDSKSRRLHGQALLSGRSPPSPHSFIHSFMHLFIQWTLTENIPSPRFSSLNDLAESSPLLPL